MTKLIDLKQARNQVIKDMRAIKDGADKRDDPKFTSEEETRWTELMAKEEELRKAIEREERMIDYERSLTGNRSDPSNSDPAPTDPKKYRHFGEFICEVRHNPNSASLETRDVSMGDGPSMGFAVPEEFDREIRMLEPNEAIVRPRATVIPAGSVSPDAAFTMLGLDQSGDKGVYGGVVVRFINELGTVLDAGDPQLKQIKYEPQLVTGFIDVSDKLLRNSEAAGAMCTKLLRGAIIGAEEDRFISGSGAGCPMGMIGHEATITVDRGTPNKVAYTDIVNMYSKVKFGGNVVVIATQSALPQLMTLKDGAQNLIWQPNARDGAPGTLLGLPVLLSDLSPVLGSEGDVLFANLTYYVIKDGSPLAIFIDPYTQKVNGLTRIYAFWNVDGQPMLNSPMLLRDGVSQVSPFVALK